MKVDLKWFVIGALALAWMHDYEVGKDYERKFRIAMKQRDRLVELTEFLAHEFDKSGIPYDDFKKIAVQEILTKD